MTPALKVKFRKRNGVPFAVERLSGVQYRCRACNVLFLEKEALERHLELKIENHRFEKPSSEAPQLNMNLMIKVIYIEDLLDSLKKEYLHDRDEYDDPWK
jgi:hypothetical protein